MKKIQSILLILALVILTSPIARADNATSTASVTNALPVSSSVSIDAGAGSVTLTEATTTNVVVTATVTDNNGYADITSVTAKLFKTLTTAAAGDDPLNHYTKSGDANCVPSAGSGLTETYTCTFAVQYYADATDAGAYSADTWSAEVTPSDSDGAGTAGSNDTIEMATTAALNVSSPIAFGALALGGITADTTAFDSTVTNTGNQATIGAQVNSSAATAMTCTTGTIPVGNEKYDATSTTAFASKTALTASAVTATGVSAAKGAAGNTDTLGWGLEMPTTGVDGSCTGTVVFTAI